ncbi:MAG: transposase [Patescibacteria group bacterium]
MSDKFRNKYRIPTARLQNWDYSDNGYYFITICTKERKHYFGEIINDKIQLSEIGMLAQKYWLEIPKHFPFVELDEFMVMPNHVHGIVIIRNVVPHVETQNFASLQQAKPIKPQNKFGSQSKNLASIIRGFKIGVKKYATIHGINFFWQSRFYDNIIRNEKSFYYIRQYIKDNPMNWENDRNNNMI